jgi:hypothetical protein
LAGKVQAAFTVYSPTPQTTASPRTCSEVTASAVARVRETGLASAAPFKKPLSYTPMNLHNRYEHPDPADPPPG